MVVDFDKLKREISLPDLLLKFGWKFEHGSSHSALKMTDGKNTYVIKRNSAGQYTYWDVHDPAIRGKSVIDFMQKHIFDETGGMPSLREVGVTLQAYIDNGEIVLPENSKYRVSDSSLDENALYLLLMKLNPYNGTFLEERGIGRNTLDSPVFSDTFFSYLFRKGEKIYNNTCIKMINESGVRGISQRGNSFKGIIGSHYDTVAVSNFDRKRPVNAIYIGESMIDCASHYQLKNNKTGNNIIYISTEGTLTEGQMKLLRKLIDHNNIKNITTIFDNDRQGYSYTIRLSHFLQGKPAPDLTGSSTEILKETISAMGNADVPQTKDWNDDLILERKKTLDRSTLAM